jgi:hypothetical protein
MKTIGSPHGRINIVVIVVCDTIAEFVIVPSMKNEHMNVNKV